MSKGREQIFRWVGLAVSLVALAGGCNDGAESAAVDDGGVTGPVDDPDAAPAPDGRDDDDAIAVGPSSLGMDDTPFVVAVPAMRLRLVPGRMQICRVTLTRRPGFTGAVAVSLHDLPVTVTARPTVIPLGHTSVEIDVMTADDAPPETVQARVEAVADAVTQTLALETEVAGKPGTLDPTFGTRGAVTTPIGAGPSEIAASAMRRDGKLVVVGTTAGPAGGLAFARHLPDGRLDPTFGASGVTQMALPGAEARALVLAPNGRIVVAGTWMRAGADVFLARLLEDGRLDTSFGEGGVAVLDFGFAERGHAVAIRADGKILVAGGTDRDGGRMLLVRTTDTGAADPSFFGNGAREVDVGSGAAAKALRVRRDGKLVLVGASGAPGDVVAARLDAGGELDTAFGDAGVATFAVSPDDDRVWAATLDGLERIVVAGSTFATVEHTFVARMTVDGAVDPTFGAGGRVVVPLSATRDVPAVVLASGDGRLILGGRTETAGVGQMFVLRLLENGNFDGGFGRNGSAVVPLGAADASGRSLALTADARIVLGGGAGVAPSRAFTLARFWP